MKRSPFLLLLLVVPLFLCQPAHAFAAGPTEQDLLPLIQDLAKNSPGSAHPFGPQLPPSFHRNAFKVKVIEIQKEKTAAVQKFQTDVKEWDKVWPVRVYVFVSYNDPSKGDTTVDGEFTCYAHQSRDGGWLVSSTAPFFK